MAATSGYPIPMVTCPTPSRKMNLGTLRAYSGQAKRSPGSWWTFAITSTNSTERTFTWPHHLMANDFRWFGLRAKTTIRPRTTIMSSSTILASTCQNPTISLKIIYNMDVYIKGTA